MKKVVLAVSAVVISLGIFAQKGDPNVGKAIKLSSDANPNFKDARTAIKEALNNPISKDDAKTWFVAGDIEDKFYKTEEEKLIAKQISSGGKPEDITSEMYNAAYENWIYFSTCDSLDRIPNEKGKVKPKFTTKMKDVVLRYRNMLPSAGQIAFSNQNYPDAVKFWGTYVDQIHSPLFAAKVEEFKSDSLYYMIAFYCSYAASEMGNKTGSIHYLNVAKQHPSQSLNAYQRLVYEYEQMKDTIKQIEVLKEGMNVFPQESFFILSLANIYIYSNQLERAIEMIDQAIAKDPKSAQLYDVKGTLLERNGKESESLTWYKKALEMDPNYAEALRNVGRYHYNQGLEAINNANTISDNKEYKKALDKAQLIYKEALPYFIKVNELLPDDRSCKVALMQIYYQLNMAVEYEKICLELGLDDCKR